VSAAHAARREAALRDALPLAAAAAGPEAVEEVLLQAYLFLGFPATIWAFGIWRSMDEDARADTEQRPDGDAADPNEQTLAGEEVCARVYSANYQKLRDHVRALHPELDRWMIREGYGKVLGRSRVDLVTRELCVVASLAVTAWEPQLHSHLRGALNVGARPDEVDAALEEGLGFVPRPAWPERARALWRQVAERHVR
jgi:4-carboxymuconolactone decarboxylase